jgi:hypothetical protein
MKFSYYFFQKFPELIANEFLYYSKNVIIDLFNELIIISNNLINDIDDYIKHIKIILNINNGDNENIKFKRALNELKGVIPPGLINCLELCWEKCFLLYQIEAYVLPHPSFIYNFDNTDTLKKTYNNLKSKICSKTYLTKRLLECFLNIYNKVIFLNNPLVPGWLSESNLKIKLSNKSIFNFITDKTKQKITEQIREWSMRESKLLFIDVSFFYTEIDKLEKLDFLWIVNISDEELIKKYKSKMQNYKVSN